MNTSPEFFQSLVGISSIRRHSFSSDTLRASSALSDASQHVPVFRFLTSGSLQDHVAMDHEGIHSVQI